MSEPTIKDIAGELLKASFLLDEAAKILKKHAKILASKDCDFEEPWVPLRQAVKQTGMSVRAMQTTIRDRLWEHGEHYINTSQGSSPRYKVDPLKVKEWRRTSPEKRPPVKRKQASQSQKKAG